MVVFFLPGRFLISRLSAADFSQIFEFVSGKKLFSPLRFPNLFLTYFSPVGYIGKMGNCELERRKYPFGKKTERGGGYLKKKDRREKKVSRSSDFEISKGEKILFGFMNLAEIPEATAAAAATWLLLLLLLRFKI